MGRILVVLFAFSLSFAKQYYGVYDLQGNRISTFEANLHELSEKARQIKSAQPNKNIYISSLARSKSSNPTSRYRYKAETGAYIEASRKETFSLCPDNKTKGTWISERSVSLNEENCLSIQTPDLAGTFRILFLRDNGNADTIQVLVDQSYIQMGDYSHKIYVYDQNVIDSVTRLRPGATWSDVLPGNYESRVYDTPLIVDKTKFTMGDAQVYLKSSNGIKLRNIKWDLVYPNEKLEESKRPYIVGVQEFRFANERSKREGLDTAYIRIDIRNYNAEDAKNCILLGDTKAVDAGYNFLLLDTSANGYRMPFKEEWFFLMRAGASTRYYWGDEEDSLKVSRYAWVNPIGLKPVAQLQPNRFGLYDMVGIAKETIMANFSYTANSDRNYYGFATTFSQCPECYFMRKTRTLLPAMRMPRSAGKCVMKQGEIEATCTEIEQKPRLVNEQVDFDTFRLIRKTPKLHKLEKF